ncbi:glycosyltransferase family 4 protein [Adhaeribacter radiodurans]|uniref:Glycosyltransferase n=1 Tax=Adhaeribacter radiodurans TaxID=2745197 RepID=A0A7L7L5V9_9BACT|nr:glycosyltransferase family 4 protein [Adhaeribacter radiodurans]QMU28198.1 glycosyltransferase [Adhaeribacter radiodurans]
MSKLNVLLLGWEFSTAIREEQETSCYYIAKALSQRVDLSVLLPHTDPNFILNNAELTGLDQLDLQGIQTSSTKPRPLPFANEPYIKNNIPLYGTSNYVTPPEGYVRPEAFKRISTSGTGSQSNSSKIQEKNTGPANIFGYKEFDALSLDAQVIEYARYTSRWALQRNFDIIYAYNYRTFLAGTELKLLTGKKLILQVDSLSYEHCQPDSKGWMYELEKQAFRKCDYILTSTGDMAVTLVKDYGISPAKLESIEIEKNQLLKSLHATGEQQPANLKSASLNKSAVNKANMHLFIQEKVEASWQPTADAIWEVIQMVATT